ncbi:hypothetical protein ACOMHN_014670 [Nucella lapillus]
MDSAPVSDNYPSGNVSSRRSGSYADIESASNARLLPLNNNKSASVIFQGDKSSRTTTTLAIISLIISVFCLVGLGLFSSWFFVLNKGELFPHAEAGLRGEKAEEVCVPCLQISPNPLDSSPSELWGRLDVKYGDDNDTEICCASTSAQFAVLFKLILQRQQAVKRLADSLDAQATKKNGSDVMKDDVSAGHVTQFGVSAVSAHLVFKPKPTAASVEETEALEQQWKSPEESPMSHVREGLQYRNKRVTVKTPGRYYVYCQVLYSPSHSPSPSSPRHSDDAITRDVASAYVRRYSILRPAAPGFLLKMRHTRHDVTKDRHSSYAGGVFQLHRGDSLYVQVSRPDLVSHDDMGTFFGLFRIGD